MAVRFPCPRQDCAHPGAKTLQGWKAHMSGKHGGYSEEELALVAGASESQPDVRQRMSSFAETIPAMGGEDATPVLGQDAAGGALPPPGPTARKVRATPRKTRKVLASIPAKILEANGIPIDEEDRAALEEAADFLQDVFGIEFEIPEEKKVVRSRFWAIAWVVGITALIFVKHKFAYIWSKLSVQQDSGADRPDGVGEEPPGS